ncbi:MAG: phosphate acyltransferase PlsX [Gammaproteobacteria bacterium]|nr:phosphate acyltransferase PlsX [Gammaproteobacteria bacterium]
MRIAVDLMGGDFGANQLVPAVERFSEHFPDIEFSLIGDRAVHCRPAPAPLCLHDRTDQRCRPDGRYPGYALRHRRESSMYRAVSAVASGEADGCVGPGQYRCSHGNRPACAEDGARCRPPAIIKAIPSTHGRCYLLDLGANINCSARQLVQFAAMGSLMCGAVEGIASPKVGLLNIGEEEGKGEDAVREAAAILRERSAIDFIGFVEGDGIYRSEADVLVCDGWVGNVALKTSEGLARFVADMIRDAFRRDLVSKVAGWLAAPVLRKLEHELSPEHYNGATLLGLNGIVVKSHGSADEKGFYHAIGETRRCVEQAIPGLLGEKIGAITGE